MTNDGYNIPARPTTYNGIEMRSRLEARFAAWLDSMLVAWEYEPKAFGDRSGQYLPDFRIDGMIINVSGRDRPLFVEIKPTLELAAGVLDRITPIVLASEPHAVVAVITPEDPIFRIAFDHRSTRRKVSGTWVITVIDGRMNVSLSPIMKPFQ